MNINNNSSIFNEPMDPQISQKEVDLQKTREKDPKAFNIKSTGKFDEAACKKMEERLTDLEQKQHSLTDRLKELNRQLDYGEEPIEEMMKVQKELRDVVMEMNDLKDRLGEITPGKPFGM